MNAQQLHDYIIKPTLEYIGGSYYSKEAAFLLLGTAAIESNCGEYIKQINGPALGIWQMEPDTLHDIWVNCDALRVGRLPDIIRDFEIKCSPDDLMVSPMFACAMARLKYSMDSEPLPEFSGMYNTSMIVRFYDYYKRVYNTPLGASTYQKWVSALNVNKIFEVKL
jgi:hypothetical protein